MEATRWYNAIRAELARRTLMHHIKAVKPDYAPSASGFHGQAARVLDAFAGGEIQNLIFTAPFQHGKSELSSRQLPAYVFGRRPDTKFVVASCTDEVAKGFARDVKRILRGVAFRAILTKMRVAHDAKDTEGFSVVGRSGYLYAVGVGGTLLSKAVDVIVYDDLYKSPEDAASPTVREKVWLWFNMAAQSRLHNGSQQLMATTRWHSDDVVGRLEKAGLVHEIAPGDEIPKVPFGHWVAVNFPAIQSDGTPLYPERHSLENLNIKRNLDPFGFECSYQGNPGTPQGLLYDEFPTYDQLPEGAHSAILDVKSKGKDFFAGVFFVEHGGRAFVTDVNYTNDGAEKTELWVAETAKRLDASYIKLENNGGGDYFARNVRNALKAVGHTAKVDDVHQKANKVAKITHNAPRVTELVVMPEDWRFRWPQFYYAVTSFKKLIEANEHDDAPDALTEIVLHLIGNQNRAKGGRVVK